ncbi:flavin reductase family protein [Streptomyces sp. B6B3]|uniref:flavin reductase family protein n=1 Tax=Streptomyces sp. B6B3 TaxID=3153570 RepID=UPI00325DAAD6
MAALAGGVCVVTTADRGGRPAGFTSTAVMSLSRSPQLIAVGVDQHSRTLPVLLDNRRFALNVLHADGESVSRRFAERSADRFADLEGVIWSTERPAGHATDGAPGGQPLPLLFGHSSYVLTCRVTQDVPAGDHRLIIGAVERILPGEADSGSLVYLRRGYHALRAA